MMLRLLSLLALLGLPLTAQLSVSVTDAKGKTVTLKSGEAGPAGPRVWLRVADHWFTLRHAGGCRDWKAWRGQWKVEAFFFQRIEVEAPAEWEPEGRALNGAWRSPEAPEGRSRWILVDERSPRTPDPVFPGSEDLPFLEGGDTLHWRFVPPPKLLAEMPPKNVRDRALRIIDFDQKTFEAHPAIVEVLRLYSGRLESPTYAPPVSGHRDLYWRMFSRNYRSAYGGKRLVDGWYWGGDILWGEGSSNLHYNADLWPLLNALLRPEHPDARSALTLGLYMLRQKCAKGLVWSRNHPFTGAWKYEKGRERRGSFYWPTTYKQWDLGLIVGWILTKDPFLGEAVALRRRYWLGRKPKQAAEHYSGRYGTRGLARPLRNLKHWYRWDRPRADEYRKRAEALIQHSYGFVREGNLWFREGQRWKSTGNKHWAPWMQAQALSAVNWWRKEGVCADRTETLTEMTRHLLNLTRPHHDSSLWITPHHIVGWPKWEETRMGHPVLNGWYHGVWTMAEELGITSVHGVPIADAARRSRETAFGRAGRGWKNIHDRANRIQLVGGVRGALGGADQKLLNGLLSGLLR